MTKHQTRQAAAVMLAWTQGADIEWRNRNPDFRGRWQRMDCGVWNWHAFEYRVAARTEALRRDIRDTARDMEMVLETIGG